MITALIKRALMQTAIIKEDTIAKVLHAMAPILVKRRMMQKVMISTVTIEMALTEQDTMHRA